MMLSRQKCSINSPLYRWKDQDFFGSSEPFCRFTYCLLPLFVTPRNFLLSVAHSRVFFCNVAEMLRVHNVWRLKRHHILFPSWTAIIVSFLFLVLMKSSTIFFVIGSTLAPKASELKLRVNFFFFLSVISLDAWLGGLTSRITTYVGKLLLFIIHYSLKIPVSLYHWGGLTFHAKGHIWKNFEAEGRTDWKSKKRSTRPQMSCFCWKQWRAKKGLDSQ